MSLVNDMLRDLNKRTPVSNRAARVHGAIQSSIESKRPKLRAGLILAGGLLAGLTAGYFYFESMGVQVVQVPLAVTPPPVQPIAPAPESTPLAAPAAEPAAQPAPVEDVAATAPAVETLATIRELAAQPNGFTLLVELSQQAPYEVRDQSESGLTLHIDGVDRFDRAAANVPGMSLLLVGDGLELGLELAANADFLVREDSETPAFDILITASYRSAPELSVNDVTLPEPEPAVQPAPSAPAIDSAPEVAAAQSGIAPAAPERAAPVRINRELSLEARDSNNSQEALMLVQGGRMTEAYARLQDFLDENPAAHQSRETLAKLLFAQQQLAEAGVIVDQGLAQVPNYAPFKKLKARLLMQGGAAAEALSLLRNVPPAVAADTEYHELLASAYQQSNNHAQAVATYQDLLRTDRTQGRWWAGLAISLEAQDKDSDALASYKAALQAPNLDSALRQYVQNRVTSLGSQQ